MTEKTLTKVTITGYLDFSNDKERDFVLGDLMRIAHVMSEGTGIMTNMDEEIIRVSKIGELPNKIQDFFEYKFEDDIYDEDDE